MKKEDLDKTLQHKGPHPGIVAIIFTLLFNAGLYFVISFSPGQPHFPNPSESADIIRAYFLSHSSDVMMCAFFQFGAAIPLGIFTATMISRLRFMGIRAAGSYIGLFGGLLASFNMALAALILWVMSYPGMAQDNSVIRALYYMMFAIGGAGYSVPLGILIAGISVSAGLLKLLPKWLVVFGIVLAIFGEASWLSMIFPKLGLLIPLTRFPGFIWLILIGFKLPKTLFKQEFATG
ncbi:MAG: DUF4386 domain-containing protein [Ginsengibacter sp.]